MERTEKRNALKKRICVPSRIWTYLVKDKEQQNRDSSKGMVVSLQTIIFEVKTSSGK